MKSALGTALVLAGLAIASQSVTAEVRVDEGSAKHTPWSGYWWPIAKGELLQGPLQKHDTLTRRRAHQWERQHNPPGNNVPEWHGYCHGWAAAAILEREPREKVLNTSRGPLQRRRRRSEKAGWRSLTRLTWRIPTATVTATGSAARIIRI